MRSRLGEKVGFVGPSGAGKTTLVNLLLRFHDLEAGRILIDGQDIAGVTQESLRAAIGMVTQDTSLLHRSIRDNVRYGRPEASEEEIRRAAALAEADRFIPELADPKGRVGYDAYVGERGVKLSGGQRQRIAIARVIPEGRADPGAGRGDLGAGLGGGGGDPEPAGAPDGGQDGDRHRAPAFDHRSAGPADRARPGAYRRAGQPRASCWSRTASTPDSGPASPAASSASTRRCQRDDRNERLP